MNERKIKILKYLALGSFLFGSSPSVSLFGSSSGAVMKDDVNEICFKICFPWRGGRYYEDIPGNLLQRFREFVANIKPRLETERWLLSSKRRVYSVRKEIQEKVRQRTTFEPGRMGDLMPIEMQALTKRQTQALGEELIPTLCCHQIRVLKVQYLTNGQVQALTGWQMQNLTEEQILNLTDEQVQALTDEQVQALTGWQVRALIRRLTRHQRRIIRQQQLLTLTLWDWTALNPKMILDLAPQLPGTPTDYLQPDQLAALAAHSLVPTTPALPE
jgi:hypothetical protein